MCFTKSQWILTSESFGENEYGEFIERFEWNGGKTDIRISVCGDYTLFVNGEFVEYDIGVTGLPILENGTILLPLYKTCEALGARLFRTTPTVRQL